MITPERIRALVKPMTSKQISVLQRLIVAERLWRNQVHARTLYKLIGEGLVKCEMRDKRVAIILTDDGRAVVDFIVQLQTRKAVAADTQTQSGEAAPPPPPPPTVKLTSAFGLRDLADGRTVPVSVNLSPAEIAIRVSTDQGVVITLTDGKICVGVRTAQSVGADVQFQLNS